LGTELVVVDDAEALAAAGADLIGGEVTSGAVRSVVAATGRTPIGLYAELGERRRSGAIDPSGLTVFQLDEYLGLQDGDPRSLLGWMRRAFVDPLGIADDRVVPLPLAGDLDTACALFDRALEERGGLDLAILGLGTNGHLGFNEPPSSPDDGTRVVRLLPETVAANARYWGDGAVLPSRAVTMGLRQILAARRIVVLASGGAKHDVVHAALEGPVGPSVPASFLQDADADVRVIVDRAAWDGDR
jgi:glucosamine-6-phosphate deaminase